MKNLAPNQPLYLYQEPMFALTVSTVLVVDNGVLLVELDNGTEDKDICGFPGGMVRAGLETIQFAAVRYVKEQTGIMLRKDLLIPVDFRSDPSRSKEGNIVDIGFACMLENHPNEFTLPVKWREVNFETRKAVDNIYFFRDHEVLLDRALEIVTIMK